MNDCNTDDSIIGGSDSADQNTNNPHEFLPTPNLSNSHWIWTNEQPPPSGPRAFLKAVSLPQGHLVDSMTIDITCDDWHTLYINGRVVGNGTAWSVIQRYSIAFPRTDRVVVAVYASNDPVQMQQAGLIAAAVMWDSTAPGDGIRRAFSVGTDASWVASVTAAASGFEKVTYKLDSSWTSARVQGLYGAAPWGAITKPTVAVQVAGGFIGLGIPDPPSAPLAIPLPDPSHHAPPPPARTTPDITHAHWIWTHEHPWGHPPSGARAFRKVLALPPGQTADAMQIDVTCDDLYTLYVNGCVVGSGTAWDVVQRYSVRFPRTERVVIAVYASNDPVHMQQAGLVASAVVWDSMNDTRRTFNIDTDSSWEVSTSAAASGFEKPDYTPDGSWTNSRVQGPYGMLPWGAISKPTTADPVTGGFTGLGIPDPPEAPLAVPGRDSSVNIRL